MQLFYYQLLSRADTRFFAASGSGRFRQAITPAPLDSRVLWSRSGRIQNSNNPTLRGVKKSIGLGHMTISKSCSRQRTFHMQPHCSGSRLSRRIIPDLSVFMMVRSLPRKRDKSSKRRTASLRLVQPSRILLATLWLAISRT